MYVIHIKLIYICIYFIKDIFANIIETFICKISATSLMDNPAVYEYRNTRIPMFFFSFEIM